MFGRTDARASSRRPRRSPRTCRGRSASRSRSSRAAKLGARRRRGRPTRSSVCSFGDASANHSTATGRDQRRGARRATRACRCRCCSSARTTASASACRRRQGWIAHAYGSRPGLEYFAADGCDLVDAVRDRDRARRRGCAATARPRSCTCAPCGSWATPAPTSRPATAGPSEIAADLRARPAAAHRAAAGRRRRAARRDEVLERYEAHARRTCVALARARSSTCPRLELGGARCTAALAPRSPTAVAAVGRRGAARDAPSCSAPTLPEHEGAADPRPVDQPGAARRAARRTRGAGLRRGRRARRAASTASPAGCCKTARRAPRVRHAARRADDPRARARRRRVRAAADPRDPVPRLPAQRRGPAARRGGDAAVLLRTAQYRNPMVVRIAGYGYQKGFGGHFHNDNARRRAARHPRAGRSPRRRGPTTPRRCCAPASRRRRSTGAVCVFLEPIALYHTRDLHDDGDGGWLAPYAAPERWADARADRPGPHARRRRRPHASSRSATACG